MVEYYVYIMTNRSKTLYVGVTNDLVRRSYEHKHKLVPGFTTRYNIARLVYYEPANNALAAIAREKQVKGWLRRRKIALIESANPGWHDLSASWFDSQGETLRSAQGDRSDKALTRTAAKGTA